MSNMQNVKSKMQKGLLLITNDFLLKQPEVG